MTFGSTGADNDQMGTTPTSMEVFVRLTEPAVDGELNMGSSAAGSLPRSGLYEDSLKLSKDHKLQPQRQQLSPEQEELKSESIGVMVEASPAVAPAVQARQQPQPQQPWPQKQPRPQKEERRASPLPQGATPAPLRRLRRGSGMSDVWQHQGAFRSNRKSMKSMFEEFEAELKAPENDGKARAEIHDIFSFTSVGHKHQLREKPTEDRIAIHQAVVPTIDQATKEELDIESIDTNPFAMFGVFDGHGGAACAQFLERSVSTVLAHSPVLYDEDLTPVQRRVRATADTFEELEKVHNEWAHKSGDLSGSTAILSTFQDGVLVMAGVGDSAGLYVDHMGNQHNLCPRHSTSNQREVERVISMGGEIINNRVAGCLMPTRTIGDLDCKRALHEIVSPHPELKLAAVFAPPDDGKVHDEPFLVIASDGLWDVLSFDQVATITRKGLQALRANELKEQNKLEKAVAKAAAKAAKASSNSRSSGTSSSTRSSASSAGSRLSTQEEQEVIGEEAAALGSAASMGASSGESDKKSGWKGRFRRRKTTLNSVDDGIGNSSHPGIGKLRGGGGMFGGLDGKGRNKNKTAGGGYGFPGTAVLPRPAGIDPLDMSKTGFMMDASRNGGGYEGYLLDGSRAGKRGGLDISVRGLDVSVRGGNKAGPIASAELDSSRYAGLLAEESRSRMALDESIKQTRRALEGNSINEVDEGEDAEGGAGGSTNSGAPSVTTSSQNSGLTFVKPVITESTEQTASVRTAGTANQNVAKLLVRAALSAQSYDDISVVVVTFTGTEDKSPPGSRHPQRTGSFSSLSRSQQKGSASSILDAPQGRTSVNSLFGTAAASTDGSGGSVAARPAGAALAPAPVPATDAGANANSEIVVPGPNIMTADSSTTETVVNTIANANITTAGDGSIGGDGDEGSTADRVEMTE